MSKCVNGVNSKENTKKECKIGNRKGQMSASEMAAEKTTWRARSIQVFFRLISKANLVSLPEDKYPLGSGLGRADTDTQGSFWHLYATPLGMLRHWAS